MELMYIAVSIHNFFIWLEEIITRHKLLDPFRYLHPNLKDFSYTPYGTMRRNRSRIDFFLVSEAVISNVNKCDIAQGVCKKFFDHKAIYLQLGKSKRAGRKAVNNRVIANPLFRLIAILATYESYVTYIHYARNGIVDGMLTNLCQNLDEIAPHLDTLLGSVTPGLGNLLPGRTRLHATTR